MDLREYRKVVLDAVAKEREADANWGWRVKRVGKKKISIRWGYLDYIGQKGDFSIRLSEDEEDGVVDVNLIGCLDDEYEDEWFRDCDADGLFIWIGDRHWHDAKTIEEGLAKMIDRIARLAHNRY